MKLFISLYLDQDVSVVMAAFLRARHFEVLTTQEANRIGSSDAEQLSFAVQNKMALLTHNREDFEKLFREYLYTGKKHHGIIIAQQKLPQEIVRRLLKILNTVTADEFENQIRYI